MGTILKNILCNCTRCSLPVKLWFKNKFHFDIVANNAVKDFASLRIFMCLKKREILYNMVHLEQPILNHWTRSHVTRCREWTEICVLDVLGLGSSGHADRYSLSSSYMIGLDDVPYRKRTMLPSRVTKPIDLPQLSSYVVLIFTENYDNPKNKKYNSRPYSLYYYIGLPLYSVFISIIL